MMRGARSPLAGCAEFLSGGQPKTNVAFTSGKIGALGSRRVAFTP